MTRRAGRRWLVAWALALCVPCQTAAQDSGTDPAPRADEQAPRDDAARPAAEPLRFEEKISVTVTANRREQQLQEVGISVTALDGETLDELAVVTTTDMTQQIPNVYLQDFLGGAGISVNAAIRGVGLNDFNPGTEPSSVIYVDEFYVAPLLAGSMLAHDLERIEVLRGPQGTLFGRNTTGGAIQFVSRDPTLETGGYVTLSAGEHSLVRLDGAANLRLSDRAAVRLSFMSETSDPWARNVGSGPDGYERDLGSVRGQLRYDITDTLSSVTKVSYGEADGLFSMRQGDLAESFDGNGFLVAGGPGPFLSPAANADFTLGETNRPDDLDSQSLLIVQRFEWVFGGVTLTSITGHLDLDQSHVQDCDGTPLDTCHVEFPYDAEETTQELRLVGRAGRSQWTAGAFYMTQDSTSRQTAALDVDGAFGGGVPGFGFGGPFVFDVDWEEEKTAWALFGQWEYDLTDELLLIAGMRYSKDRKTFDFLKRDFVAVPGSITDRGLDPQNLFPGVFIEGIGANVNFTANGPPLPIDTNFDLIPDTLLPPAGDLTRYRDDLVNGKLGINWQPTDDLLVYASWTRGTKAGGFNNGFVSPLTNAEIPFGAETIHAAEVGFKSILLGRRLQISGAVFHYDFDDYQAVAFEGLGTRTVNRDASVTGADLELISNFRPGWEARLGLGLLDTTVQDIDNGTSIFDAEMGLAPSTNVNGVLRWAHPIGERLLILQADGYRVDDQFQDVLNDPGVAIPSHFMANLRATLVGGDGRWEVTGWVRNVTDEVVPNFRYNLDFGSIISTYKPPRWVGMGVTYRF